MSEENDRSDGVDEGEVGSDRGYEIGSDRTEDETYELGSNEYEENEDDDKEFLAETFEFVDKSPFGENYTYLSANVCSRSKITARLVSWCLSSVVGHNSDQCSAQWSHTMMLSAVLSGSTQWCSVQC
ncbi:hypothetical protein CRG98_008899 [Punica granatum]|uniref:Uncharacterized protein n=1 Tax=Punica granatum TaxID=22663 RepID=A0A2I0KS44_PUNGR|nr:hypothetical protein CRG98_008899 [Punica granatum]